MPKPKVSAAATKPSSAAEVDAKIKSIGDWRGRRLAELRALIKKTDAGVVEEMKWKKPSNPAGVPVWSHDGILCVGEPLKSAVRLTFPNGALLKDPRKLFNARLEGNTTRAIDFQESTPIDETALKALILEAVRLNGSKARR
jgi:hypothetical protein